MSGSSVSYKKESQGPSRVVISGTYGKLISNLFTISSGSIPIHIYDITVLGRERASNRERCLSKGPHDDATKIQRMDFCCHALQVALEDWGELRDGDEVVYDGAGFLLANIDILRFLPQDGFFLNLNQLDPSLVGHLHNIETISIKIGRRSQCFEINDFALALRSKNMDELRRIQMVLDHLTNSPFPRKYFNIFGNGKIFPKMSGNQDQNRGTIMNVVDGWEKGILFCEPEIGENPKAALIIDTKKTSFFKELRLSTALLRHFRAQDFREFDNRRWRKIHYWIMGLRVLIPVDDGGREDSFICSGLSSDTVSELNNVRFSNQTYLSFDSHLSFFRNCGRCPAVIYEKRIGNNRIVPIFYPLDTVLISPNQRVPIEKLIVLPTKIKVNERFVMILGTIEDIQQNDKVLSNFDLRISPRSNEVEAIQRMRPEIKYRYGENARLDESKGNWRMGPTHRFVLPATINRIIVAFDLTSDVSRRNVESMVDTLRSRLNQQDINPDFKLFESAASPNLIEKFVKIFEFVEDQYAELKRRMDDPRQMLIYIDSKTVKDSHSILKLFERWKCFTTQQISSEVVKDILSKTDTCSSIISKINMKMGGLNYTVVPDEFSRQHWISNERSLIFGYDVCHPTNRGKTQMSVSSVGFSFNGTAHPEAFVGDFHLQTPRQERVEEYILIDQVSFMLGEFYKARREKPPDNIIIIRDGVSEGQFQMVLNREFAAIKDGVEAFRREKGIGSEWKPRFLLAIIIKGHKKRFAIHRGRNGFENTPVGTVIDTQSVRLFATNFLMQSHHNVLGTPKFSDYVIPINELEPATNNQDMVQSFMLALCFSHQISNGGIHTPEPIYQADAWANRGQNLFNSYLRFYDQIGASEPPHLHDYDRNLHRERPLDFKQMTQIIGYRSSSFNGFRVNA